MEIHSGTKLGVLLIVLSLILLFSGCTQPATAPAGTPTPTAPTSTPAAPVANETLKTELAGIAATFAGEINGSTLAAAYQEGPNSTAYAEVLGQLRDFRLSDGRIKFIYTLAQQNGTVWFIVDSHHGLPEASQYLEVYDDAAPELKTPVTAPIGAGPYTDKWGTFYSGYAPVETGEHAPVFLIGVDMEA